LSFHKKKHAVNTLSSTQVRKGVYKDSLQAWMRYKDHLGPLLELIGDRVDFDMRTTLPTYQPPSVDDGGPAARPESVRFEDGEDGLPASVRMEEVTSSKSAPGASPDELDRDAIRNDDEL
jgi:hypothetical protein